jgi:pimeloyl-ACP methyl ester carboxylesterase
LTGNDRATVVLVHGAWSGSWMWGRVLPLLVERGIAARAVDLPSCRASSAPLVGLAGDEAAVSELLDQIQGDIVLCGHSYGGMVITGAASGHARVRRLLYLCAFMPAEGESLLGMFDGVVPSFWRIRDDLTVLPELDEAALRASDLDPEDRLLMASRRVPQSLTAYTEPPTGIAWRSIPSTYAVCTNDASFPTELQRTLATRATDTVELPTGHQPMLTRPELVADLLTGLAAP